MMKLQFEATPAGNSLSTLDGTIRATVAVPEGASEDYGYMAMKNAILAAYHGSEELEFWYDGQEQFLSADAYDGEPEVEIEEAPAMTIRAFDENQTPVTVSLIGDRHLVVNGKEITSIRDLSYDEQRSANRACDDLYDCPIFDGKRIITTTMPNSVTAYAWQLAERVDD